jgi:hypothetical protein
VRSAAVAVGAKFEDVKDPSPDVTSKETCQAYAVRLAKLLPELRKLFLERIRQFEQFGQDKLKNIPAVAKAYQSRSDRLKQELESARKQQQEKTATSIAENLWIMVLVLGGIAIVILVIVRLFPERTQLELVQSGQVIQFITVLLLLTVIMALGLSGVVKENTLGTLLGGLAGYVLSQGVGRIAQHEAKKETLAGVDGTATK